MLVLIVAMAVLGHAASTAGADPPAAQRLPPELDGPRSSGTIGSTTLTRAPRGLRFSAIAVPPWARASSRTIDRPSRCPARIEPGRRGRTARTPGRCRPARTPARHRDREGDRRAVDPGRILDPAGLEPDDSARDATAEGVVDEVAEDPVERRADRRRARDRPTGRLAAIARRRVAQCHAGRPGRGSEAFDRGREDRIGVDRLEPERVAARSEPVDRAELADEALQPRCLLDDRRAPPAPPPAPVAVPSARAAA